MTWKEEYKTVNRKIIHEIEIVILLISIVFLVTLISSCSPGNETEVSLDLTPIPSLVESALPKPSPYTHPTVTNTPLSFLEPTILPTNLASATTKVAVDQVATPSPTLTRTPSATPTLSDTSRASITLSVVDESNPISVAITYSDVGDIVLASPVGHSVRVIHLENHNPLGVEWSSDNCRLNVTVTSGEEIGLLIIDMAGNLLNEFYLGGSDSSSEWRTWPALSPSEKWVSYVVWSGERHYFGAEFQDVEVINTENNQVFRLTANGGAGVKGATWSPDGTRLAYSDYDAAGVAQLYHSDPEGRDRLQLSGFSEESIHIGPIEWAPNSQMLAFMVDQGGDAITLWVIAANGTELGRMPLPGKSLTQNDTLWWSVDNISLMANFQGEDAVSSGFLWIDGFDGQVLDSLNVSDAPFEQMDLPSPITDDQLLFFSGDGEFFTFNRGNASTKSWAQQSSFSPNITQWSIPIQISPVRGETNVTSCESNAD